MEELHDVKKEIELIRQDHKDLSRDVRKLETRTTINEKDINNINEQLKKIGSNTTWILRIIIGAILLALLGLVLKGGTL